VVSQAGAVAHSPSGVFLAPRVRLGDRVLPKHKLGALIHFSPFYWTCSRGTHCYAHLGASGGSPLEKGVT